MEPLPPVSDKTYGKTFSLPGSESATITYSLAPTVPIFNALINLTGEPVSIEVDRGTATIQPAPIPLRVEYERLQRIAVIVVETGSDAARVRELVVPNEENKLLAFATTNVQVYSPRKLRGWMHPLPILPEKCSGVIVTKEVADALHVLPLPYKDEEEDEDEEKIPTKAPPRRRVPVYTINEEDGRPRSLVRHLVGL